VSYQRKRIIADELCQSATDAHHILEEIVKEQREFKRIKKLAMKMMEDSK